MLKMQIKFFEGSMTKIEMEFNKWAPNKYIQETKLQLKRNKDEGILKVVYGVK